MEKGYYMKLGNPDNFALVMSQSTIKMEKGYYWNRNHNNGVYSGVAIHNKNGKGLLPEGDLMAVAIFQSRNPQ